MRLGLAFLLAAALPQLVRGAGNPATAAEIEQQLANLSIDATKSFHVRDLHLRRGDVSIYLSEGALAFAKPVAGHTIAAVFTTEGSEAGDGEIILLPSQPAERGSLASATGSPNLDEHFDLAVLLFSDATAKELLADIAERSLSSEPPPAPGHMSESLAIKARQATPALVRTLLDAHTAQEGIFLATFIGRQLGTFDFMYQPDTHEPVVVGAAKPEGFQIWTSFRPRHMSPFVPRAWRMDQYRIDGAIGDDLGLTAIARFRFTPDATCGRTIPLVLSPHLQVTSATIDGRPAEVLQSPPPANGSHDTSSSLLLVSDSELLAGHDYEVAVHYAGSVISRISGSYFVGERTSWYPHVEPLLTTFDITLRCPDRFRLVITGQVIDDSVSGRVRTVHCRSSTPYQLAGFNLGVYQSTSTEARPYRIETYAENAASAGMNGVPEQAARVLTYYTQRWMVLPYHNLAITPIPGYFGQGFPGLIYLSNVAYLREADRPAALQGERINDFFSELLLPHEIAHQWWGNLITSANYRSAWLMEAMANYAALEFLDQNDPTAMNRFLARYRQDLLQTHGGKPVEQDGPVDFGIRILQNAGEQSWHNIVYGKGSWALHMLNRRLGDSAFHELEKLTLETYSGRSITNDDFRALAASLNTSATDKTLAKFFDTWIYGQGIPALQLKKSSDEWTIYVSGVDESFTADLPLTCKSSRKAEQIRWVPIVSGDNFVVRRAGEVCQLPKETDYLYVPHS